MKKPILILSALLLLAILTVFAVPVYADTPDPDSNPVVDRINIFRNLRETGDFLLVYLANIPYATPPDTSINETFIWRLIDIDGVTVLGSTVGYPYNDDGFGYNVFSMYFDAADAPAWGQAYTIRLAGNPAVFDTPPVYNFTINASYYTSLTDSEENQAALATEILWLAADLNVKWALASAYKLTWETETATVLSTYGEDVFRGCIYGVQALAPNAFRFVVSDINAPDRSWNGTYVDELTNQWAGTWVETSQNSSRDFLGTDYDLMSIMLMLGLCVGLFIGNVVVTGDHWNGLLDATFILVISARLGVYSLTYLGLIAALCILYIGTRIWRSMPI